jgi:proline iminopeptidase
MADERIVVADDGVRLWSSAAGAGVPVVFCHGGPGLWDTSEPVVAMVDDLAFVVRWDQRGAGRSDPVGPYSVARCVADLDQVRAAWGLDPVVVAGHSWGAGLALRYAVARPERVSGLVCIAGTDLGWRDHRAAYLAERRARLGPHLGRWEELATLPRRDPAQEREFVTLTWSTDFAAGAADGAGDGGGRDHDRALALARRWGHHGRPIAHEANAAIAGDLATEDAGRLDAAVGALAAPALVLHGAADPRPVAGPAALARRLPRGRLVVLPGVGHVPWAERPHLLRAALREFLADLGPGT